MGLTNQVGWVSDIWAWNDYLAGSQNIHKTIEPNEYLDLFTRPVQPESNFGIIGRISFTQDNGEAAEVTLFDIAYIDSKNSGNATEAAVAFIPPNEESGPHRGKGTGFYETFDLSLVMKNDDIDMAKVISVGIKTDSFNGEDMIQVVDSSGQIEITKLAGSYGVQMNINLKFTNNTGLGGNFRVVLGSTGGVCYPFVSYNGIFGYPVQLQKNGRINDPYYLADMIDLGWVENGGYVKDIKFFTSLVAQSAGPLVIGVRRV